MVQQRKVPPAGRMKHERILLLWWHSVLARVHTPSSLQDNLLPTCQLCKLTPSSNRSVGRRNIYYFKTLQETFSYRENLNKLFTGPFTDEIADLRMSVAKRHRTALHGKWKHSRSWTAGRGSRLGQEILRHGERSTEAWEITEVRQPCTPILGLRKYVYLCTYTYIHTCESIYTC